MLVRSNNNLKDDKDWLSIGQKEYNEVNPFGYKDYNETFDKMGFWKTVEYTDEKGEKVVKEINPIGQVIIQKIMNNKDSIDKKREIMLEEALLEELDFDDQQEIKNENRYDWQNTPEPEPDENNLSENDFYKMDWRKTQYQIYRLLLNISSSLSDKQEVSKQNDK